MKSFYLLLILALIFSSCSDGGNTSSASSSKNENNNTNPTASNTFPTNYYPTQAHPRLWLTQERLDALRTQKENQTQKWNDFKEMCDSIIDKDTSNDPYGLDTSPQNFTAPLALMYRLTQENKYADKALELMEKVDLDFSRYGDADHESFEYLALTYDWLYDYKNMTQERKSLFKQKMHAISDKFWNEYNINASGTDSDNNLLTAMFHLMFGVALYGDDTNATTLLDRAWQGWSKGYFTEQGTANRNMIKSALGGVYFTGMAYFPSTDIIGIAAFEYTLQTACNYNINTLESELKPFWSNTILAIIALTEPTKKRILDYGSWQDPNNLSEQAWMRRAMILLSFFAQNANDNTSASLAKGYDKNVDIGYNTDYFLELFFDKTDIKAKNPYNANLPLIKFFPSPDFLLFRDSWEKNSSFGEFRGDGSVPLDQQSQDNGHFSLWRNGSYLTKGARNYESLSHGDFFNILSLENNCNLNGSSCSGTPIFNSEKSAKITRDFEHNNEPLFGYSMLNADGQWNDNPNDYNPVANIQTYRRHFFWTPHYVVIFDRVRAKKPIDIRYRLRALQKPDINGSIVSQLSENNNSKLLQKTLEPEDVIIHQLNESEEWATIPTWVINSDQRKWQSYIDFNNTDSVNILNLIQLGDENMSNFDTLQYFKTNENSTLRIGDWVINFATDETLRNSLSYTVANSIKNMHHFIGDLEDGIYSLKIGNKKQKNITITTKTHSAYFTSDINLSTMQVVLQKL